MLITDRAAPHQEDARESRGWRADTVVLGAELVFVAIASIAGLILKHHGVAILVNAPPLAARLRPHVGPAIVIPVSVGLMVVWWGFTYAQTMRWGRLLVSAYLTAVAWTTGLALIDGWHRGIARHLATPDEYVPDAARVTDIHRMLSRFATHILAGPANAWPTDIAGHPPGAFLIFVLLDRIGLGGGGWAGVTCILIGSLAGVAVAVTIRALGSDTAARTALPFLVLFPGAIWVGVSADGLFAGVAATGVALLALPGWWRAVAGGILLGYALYLSYGLVLFGLVALAVLLFKPGPRLVSLIAAAAGAGAVVVGFSLAGFWWLDGYHLVVQRYYQGWGALRPYSYWVWADLAALVACAGPVLWPALRQAGAGLPAAIRSVREPRPLPASTLLVLLPLLALVGILSADLSGLSKAEVERIWLPFAIWLLPAATLLPTAARRPYLIAQAVTAIAVNTILLTAW